MARLGWATGYRIDHHINYARSQKNNHALSEACGLMLIGHLFPELRDAQRWFDRGRTIFCEEMSRQVYGDGSYVQHSINYHRVMLQDATMAGLLAKWHDQPLDADTLRNIAASEEFLFQMLDPTTGRAPLYGNNDGDWVLSPDECDFQRLSSGFAGGALFDHRKAPICEWTVGRRSSVVVRTRIAGIAARAVSKTYLNRVSRRRLLHTAHRQQLGHDSLPHLSRPASPLRFAAL